MDGWMDGDSNGQRTSTWNDKTKYFGEYKDNKRNGQGTFTYFDGKYLGEWKDGDSDGQGTKTWSSGNKYVGSWKNGCQDGQGTSTFNDGINIIYIGGCKDEKQNGQETKNYPDGRIMYLGDWKDGERCNGTEYDKDGLAP